MATDLAARIGGRRPLFRNMTWTRPGLEEEKSRSHRSDIEFGKGHRLSAQRPSWDKSPTGYDSEASSLNDEDTETVQPEITTLDIPSRPRTPTKPRFLRNRLAEKTVSLTGALIERIGTARPPEGEAQASTNVVVDHHRTSSESGNNEVLVLGDNAEEGTGSSAAVVSLRSSDPESTPRPPLSSPKFSAKAVADKAFEEKVPGLNLSRTQSEGDSKRACPESVDKIPLSSIPDASSELVDSMRKLLVPIVVKKAEREAASNPNYRANHETDIVQKAQSLITDDVCQEFIRHAVSSSSALEKDIAENPSQPQDQDVAMSSIDATTLPVPEEPTQSVESVTVPAAASKPDGLADAGKTVLPSHPPPTGPRSMQVEKHAPSNHHDDREVLGSSKTSTVRPVKGKEREWDMDGTSVPAGRYHRYQQPTQSRRSRSPRSISMSRRSRSPSGSFSRSLRKPSPPRRYRRDSLTTREGYRDSRQRSRSPSFPRYDDRDRVRRPAPRPSPSSRYHDRRDRRDTRRSPSPRYQERNRRPSLSYEPRERTSARSPSPWYDKQERPWPRRRSPIDDTRHRRAPRDTSPSYPYDDRGRGRDRQPSPARDSRHPRASSPRFSSSRGLPRSRSPSRGRVSPPLSAQPTSYERPPKRKDYSPVARNGPPRGWSREPPARAPPEGPFPKKSKHEPDYDQNRSNYERPALSPTSARKPFIHDTKPFARGSPRKYQHICHRPAGFRCDHASHNDDLEQKEPQRRVTPATTQEKLQPDRALPLREIASTSNYEKERQSKADSSGTLEKGDWQLVARTDSTADSLYANNAPTSASPNLAALSCPIIPTVDANVPLSNGPRISPQATDSPIPGLGKPSVVKPEPVDDVSVWDAAGSFDPPGTIVPTLSVSSTVLDVPSDLTSLSSSSSETVVHRSLTPPPQSSISLDNQLKDESADRKPDIKVLEASLPSVNQGHQRTAIPVMPVAPPLPQRGVPFVWPVPPLPFRPTAAGARSAVKASLAASNQATSSQRAVPPTCLPGPSSVPVRVKVEDVETGESPFPVPLDQARRSSNQRVEARSSLTSDTLPATAPTRPIDGIAAVKQEPESYLPEALCVPGVWLVQQGADSVKTVDMSFRIEDSFACEWAIPSQSDSDNPNESPRAKPKVNVQLLCFLADTLRSVDWRGNPQAVWELPQDWPMVQDLIIVSNHDTPGQQVWMSHSLPKQNGSGRPVLIERHIYSGLNTLRIIQLADLSRFTFVLVAKPDPEASAKSQSSAADRYDNYFAKLREGPSPKSRGKGKAPSRIPAAGTVTVQLISSDEEF